MAFTKQEIEIIKKALENEGTNVFEKKYLLTLIQKIDPSVESIAFRIVKVVNAFDEGRDRYFVIGKHDNGGLLGIGAEGKVKSLTCIESGEAFEFVLKSIHKRTRENIISRQLNAMSKDKEAIGQRITKLKINAENKIDTGPKTYLLMKRAPGKEYLQIMESLIADPKSKTAFDLLEMCYAATCALANFFSTKKTHGDVKIENIFFDDKTGNAKLVDYGSVKEYQHYSQMILSNDVRQLTKLFIRLWGYKDNACKTYRKKFCAENPGFFIDLENFLKASTSSDLSLKFITDQLNGLAQKHFPGRHFRADQSQEYSKPIEQSNREEITAELKFEEEQPFIATPPSHPPSTEHSPFNLTPLGILSISSPSPQASTPYSSSTASILSPFSGFNLGMPSSFSSSSSSPTVNAPTPIDQGMPFISPISLEGASPPLHRSVQNEAPYQTPLFQMRHRNEKLHPLKQNPARSKVL